MARTCPTCGRPTNLVSNAPLRAIVQARVRSGEATYTGIARALGYPHPTKSTVRIKRTLGITAHTSTKKRGARRSRQLLILERTARAYCKALDLDPVDVGI